MRKILAISLLFFTSVLINGQTPIGSWSDHLVYTTADCIAVGAEEVFASTGSSLLIYNKGFDELKKMSRINGLTETGISTIGWSEENKTLIIAYISTNVDLLINNIVYNIPDINRKYIPGQKKINRIRTKGKFAYLACSFGIVVVDLEKKEIYDTWKPGTGTESTEIWDIAFGNDKIYAATSMGVYSANLADPGLSYFGNWKLNPLLPNPVGKYTSIIFSGNKLYVNLTDPLFGGDRVYVVDDNVALLPFISGVFNRSFDEAPGGFTISSANSVKIYSSNGSLSKTISSFEWGSPNISQAVIDNGDIWIADLNSGLIKSSQVTGEKITEFKMLNLPGPDSNSAFNITSYNGKTIICGGATNASWNNQGRSMQISIFDNNNWSSLTPGTIIDPMRTLIDPDDVNHIFVSTWGMGLLEYRNNILVNQFDEKNSPLQTIIPGQHYVRICGMAMDKSKNLWITQTEVQGSLKILKPDDRSWIVNPLTIDAPTIGDLIITSIGQKWVVLPRGNGLFVFDDNKTPEVFSDDRYKKLLVQDLENQVVSFVYSVAEDLDGNIWVGTDQGPLIYYNPDKVFDSDLRASRIKIPRNDGTNLADYMLKTETITSIAVDGANRKWIGTSGSGAYLLSADGTVQILSFNEQNSPLLSNNIVSLAVDNKTGEVWFGTTKGVQSYRGDAIEGGAKFTKVYTFPDPVREDFTGNVTITGLIKDTQVKITDISGNLVFETVSEGGQASWDLKNYKGRRVATGVYLVFCVSKDGSQSCVTKMLVM